jgi:cobalt transporter subunit CbtA
MLYRLLATGLISGAVAGIIVTIAHMLLVAPLIFEAEQYENAGPAAAQVAAATTPAGPVASHTHDSGLTHAHAGGATAHGHGEEAVGASGAIHVHEDASAHTHDAWEPEDGFERTGFTLLANILAGIAFGLLMATALTLYGKSITIIQGLMWGTAGFLSFAFLPSLGLPPELPGAAAGELFDRQFWWLATATVSAGGLAALVFAAGWTTRIAGIVLLLAPHVVGAPHAVKGEVGLAPPELAAHFVINSLFSSLVMWLVIGCTIAYVMQRMDAQQTSGVGAGSAVS